MSPLDEWTGPSIGSIPIGQGVAVTAMQMLAAYNVIANNGVYVAPKLVSAVEGTDGRHASAPSATRRVVSPDTARAMRAMMTEVVKSGTGTGGGGARLPGGRQDRHRPQASSRPRLDRLPGRVRRDPLRVDVRRVRARRPTGAVGHRRDRRAGHVDLRRRRRRSAVLPAVELRPPVVPHPAPVAPGRPPDPGVPEVSENARTSTNNDVAGGPPGTAPAPTTSAPAKAPATTTPARAGPSAGGP